ncbi:MAG: 1-deoxy-D-xylulose-5-phosphate reductoisomerase [candidate division WS1 bacterium]|nr:1-deoxy-D-xylulose-5-phosphate reductoisomerase [candidate division WS1 bacterium]
MTEGRKRLAILGSTGSIGEQTLEMVRAHPDRLEVVALAAGGNARRLAEQAREFEVDLLALADETAATGASMPRGSLLTGAEGVCDLVRDSGADLVIGAISGVAGLRPLLVALEAGIDCALANKEPLVAAGPIVTDAARQSGAQLLPIDSEISAIFQCLRGERASEVERVLLTASGGPFSRLSAEELAEVTAERALDHPTWKMGRKVTIDSATRANKGFEVFEVHWMFGVDVRHIEVVVHHQSIIHSLVQFHDGAVMAQMGPPDMRMPIQFAIFYPDRVANELPRMSLPEIGQLTFAEPDMQRFPCLRLAFAAARAGRSYPSVLNAADEVAVEAFLNGRIGFMQIPELIERALEEHQAIDVDSLGDVEEADAWARRYVSGLI